MADSQLIHVLVVATREQVSEWMISTLRAEPGVVLVGAVASLERAEAAIGQRRTDILLLDSAAPDAQRLERIQAIAAQPMSPAIVLLVGAAEMPFVQQALFAGARGFLLKPFTQDQLMASLRQTADVIAQQRSALSAAPMAAVEPDDSAEVFVLFSPKGGIGRTSLATSLAIALHQEANKQVTLIDGDLQFGDADIALNVMARKSSADLLAYVNELDRHLIDSALINHASGIRLLLAPPYFDPAVAADEGRLAHIVKSVATTHSGYVVVDAPAGLGEATLNLLDIAQRVLLVTAVSVASLRATKRFLELAAKMDYTQDKIVLVLSGYRKDDIPLEEIERHLSWPVSAVIPSDPVAMAMALNQGQPIVLRDRNHPISKAIIKLARYLGTGPAKGLPRSVDADQPSPTPSTRPAAQLFMRFRSGSATGS
jgi:pilus assembly protein CpaE